MSSSYHLLCMSHDPAMEIQELNNQLEFPTSEELQETHSNCDFVVSRVSGGLVELGCPGFGRCPCGGHSGVLWVDVDWIRLLAYFEPDDPRPELQKLFKRPTMKCWSYERIYRLRHELRF